MFEHHLETTKSRRVAASWFLLSFSAGYCNACGFLATGRFVSHVTGFATLFGVDFSRHDLLGALGTLSVPMYFLLGAFGSGMLIDRQIRLHRRPHFDYVMLLSAACLIVLVVQHVRTPLRTEGGMLDLRASYLHLVLLCLCCGLQNAAITSASARSVRTTHLTGLTTDLGLGLARLFTFTGGRESWKNEIFANLLRFGSIVSFILGSAAGALLFTRFRNAAFALPTFIALYAAREGQRAKRRAGSAAAA